MLPERPLDSRPVTIAISTLERHATLCDTLDALCSIDLDAVLEVLIVDQSTKPLDPAPWLGWLPLRVIAQNARGLGVSRNELIAQAKTDIVLFIDDDVLPDHDLASQHLRMYAERPSVVGVAGYERIGAKSARRTWRNLARSVLVRTLSPYLRHHATYSKFLDARGRPVGLVMRCGLLLCDFSRSLPCRVMTPRGCNMSFRRDVLQQVGGFDPAWIGPRRDETDLALRIASTLPDAEIWFNPLARLVHWMTPSGGCRSGNARERRLRDLECELRFARRHLRGMGRVLCILRVLIARVPALARHPSLFLAFLNRAETH